MMKNSVVAVAFLAHLIQDAELKYGKKTHQKLYTIAKGHL